MVVTSLMESVAYAQVYALPAYRLLTALLVKVQVFLQLIKAVKVRAPKDILLMKLLLTALLAFTTA